MMPIGPIAFLEFCADDVEAFAADTLAPFGFVESAVADDPLLDSHCRLFVQNDAIVAVTAAESGPAREYVERHGAGVSDIAFVTSDVQKAFDEAVAMGAEPVREPAPWWVGSRKVARASVRGIGDIVHSFVGDGFAADLGRGTAAGTFLGFDHIAICVESGGVDAAMDFYQRVLGFHISHEETVRTARGGMISKVVASKCGRFRCPIQEPLSAGAPGQITDFLERHGGPGVQHVAFLTDDILEAVAASSEQDVEFLDAPPAYYTGLDVARLQEDVRELKAANVLIEEDKSGYLLQIFSKSFHQRRTLFFELIQRRAAEGFGSNNIRALFRALEQHSA